MNGNVFSHPAVNKYEAVKERVEHRKLDLDPEGIAILAAAELLTEHFGAALKENR